MTNMPLISVVLPVYNGETHLHHSIDSILNQTYTNFELIVVNDCSTDNTLEIIRDYAARDTRIKVISNKENLKLPKTLNVGFANATGDFYTWTSDDNMYKGNALEVLLNALRSNSDIDLVYSDFTYIDVDGVITGYEIASEPDNIVFGNVCGASFMYTRKIAESIGEYDAELFLAEDYDYWMRIYLNGKMMHINDNLYLYRRHSQSLTSTKQYSIATQTFKAYQKNFEGLLLSARAKGKEKDFFSKMQEYAVGEYGKVAGRLIRKNASAEYKKYYYKTQVKNFLRRIKSFCVRNIGYIKYPGYILKDKRVNSIINDSQNSYRYVHIIHNDKFCCPFVNFINEQFDEKEHLFLVKRAFPDMEFPKGDNVYEFYRLRDLELSSAKIEKVILHSLFLGEIEYWADHIEMLRQKVYWMIWGADLYEASRTDVDDLVRKNFYGYISDTDGDCDVVKEKYRLSDDKIFINAAYTFPITMKMVENAKLLRKQQEYIQIQINNSCDWSIIDMLKRLKRFKKENIKIVCVLSYGEGERCKQEIIKTGRDIFGDKFTYLDNFCKPQEYAHWLAQNDVYILNQDRQQGLGNAFASLALGAKVFIKSTVTTYHHFNDKGINVYDTLTIDEMTFDELINYEVEVRVSNQNKVRYFFDNKYLKKRWEPVFNDSK